MRNPVDSARETALKLAATRLTRQHNDSLLQLAQMRDAETKTADWVNPQILVPALRACEAHDAPL